MVRVVRALWEISDIEVRNIMMILVLRDDKHVANDITNTQYTDGKIGVYSVYCM